jgi:hypothetical protein
MASTYLFEERRGVAPAGSVLAVGTRMHAA